MKPINYEKFVEFLFQLFHNKILSFEVAYMQYDYWHTSSLVKSTNREEKKNLFAEYSIIPNQQ